MNYQKIGDVCEILDSQRIPITASERKAGPYPYCGANGIQDYVDDYIFDDELVLLAEDGGNFGSKDRPIAYRISGKCWVNNHAHVLKPLPGIDVDYLCYALMYYDTNGLVNGATRQKLTQAAMRQMIIPVRGLAEQKAIVEKIQSLTMLIALRKSHLQKLNQLASSRFIEMFGDPVENPQKWAISCLKSIIEYANNGMTRRGNDESGSIVLRLVELQCGYLDYTAPNRIVLTEQEKTRFLLQSGDFLFARVNGNPENVGRCTYFKGSDEPVYHNDHIIRVRFKTQTISPEYLQHLLNSPYGRNEMRGKIKTSAGQYTINQEGIGSIRIPLPPLALQNEFAAFIEQLDKSKVTIQKSLDRLNVLYRSLLQEYFC